MFGNFIIPVSFLAGLVVVSGAVLWWWDWHDRHPAKGEKRTRDD